MSVWISWLHKAVNIGNIHSLYFYLHAIKCIPNVKQHLVCSFAGLHAALLSLCEFIIPECIQRAMHLLLPCCHHVKYIKNKFLCSNWFSNMLSFCNIPAITTKKCFDSLGQDLVHLINLTFYCEISRSTLQFICYMLLAFLMWGCTSSFSSKYLLLQTEILTSDITTFQPCLYIWISP